MEHFYEVFEKMGRQGPGSAESTVRAFESIPNKNQIRTILDIGCGKGASCLALASVCNARITAVDNHQPFLDSLKEDANRLGFANRIDTFNASMFELPYPDDSFDLIWAEGSAYIMGFEKALCEWKGLLHDRGYLFVSDAVLLTDHPSLECTEFWTAEYPDITTPSARRQMAIDLGYTVLDTFILPQEDWKAFYDDMLRQVESVIHKHGLSQALDDMKNEIRIANLFGDEFSYVCLLLQK